MGTWPSREGVEAARARAGVRMGVEDKDDDDLSDDLRGLPFDSRMGDEFVRCMGGAIGTVGAPWNDVGRDLSLSCGRLGGSSSDSSDDSLKWKTGAAWRRRGRK